jgi:hypothetical protein
LGAPRVTDHIEVTRKVAAQRQIDAAVAHLKKFELECAITLAAAAETMLPDTTTNYVFDYLRRHPAFTSKAIDFNETINWLKHSSAPESKIIFAQEAAFVVFRAMSKFGAVYDECPMEWSEFLRWGAEQGFWPADFVQ